MKEQLTIRALYDRYVGKEGGKEGEDRAEVCCWVSHCRVGGRMVFLSLSDGTTFRRLQGVCESKAFSGELLSSLHTGVSVRVEGKVVRTPSSAQPFELYLSHIEILGGSDPAHYPLQPRRIVCLFCVRKVIYEFGRTLLGAFFVFVIFFLIRCIVFFILGVFFMFTRLF